MILLCILLSVVIMTVQTAPNVYTSPRPTAGYFHTWMDYGLFGLFITFTIEILARIVVTGLFINPPLANAGPAPAVRDSKSPALGASTASAYPPPSTHELGYSQNFRTLREANSTTSLVDNKPSRAQPLGGLSLQPDAAATGFTAHALTPFVQSIRRQRTTYQQAFLRHSWNRLDAVAVVSFWISFVLALYGIEAAQNVYIFRALSVLRATRLLAITAGTTVRSFPGPALSRKGH